MNEEEIKQAMKELIFIPKEELIKALLNKQQEVLQLKEQLKQRDEVINKAIDKLGRYVDEMVANGNAYAICVDLLDALKNTKEITNE